MIPTTCQSPVACNSPVVGRFRRVWLCRACLDYTDAHNELPKEEPMSIADRVAAYLTNHGPTHTRDLAKNLGVNPSSISSAIATLRGRGVILPPAGDGTAALVPTADTYYADLPPTTTTYADNPTEDDGDGAVPETVSMPVDGDPWQLTQIGCPTDIAAAKARWAAKVPAQLSAHPELQMAPDTVQTSEADALRAEVARLAAENRRLTEELEDEGHYSGSVSVSDRLHTANQQLVCYSAAIRLISEAFGYTDAPPVPTDDPEGFGFKFSEWLNDKIGARIREFKQDFCGIYDALGNGTHEDIWPPGKSAAEAVKMLVDEVRELRAALDNQGISTEPEALAKELDTIRDTLADLQAENKQLRTRAVTGPTAHLEWRGHNLYLIAGTLTDRIATIERLPGCPYLEAKILPGQHTMIARCDSPEEGARILTALLALHGLTVPPLPTEAK